MQIPNSNAGPGPGPGMMNPQMMMAQQRMPMGNNMGPMMRSGQMDPSMSGPGGPNGPMMGPGPQHMRPQMTSQQQQMMMQMQSQQHQMQMGNRPPPPDYGKIMPHQVRDYTF